jgi:hypothetical protein
MIISSPQKWTFSFMGKPFQIQKMVDLKARLFQTLLRLDIQVGRNLRQILKDLVQPQVLNVSWGYLITNTAFSALIRVPATISYSKFKLWKNVQSNQRIVSKIKNRSFLIKYCFSLAVLTSSSDLTVIHCNHTDFKATCRRVMETTGSAKDMLSARSTVSVVKDEF